MVETDREEKQLSMMVTVQLVQRPEAMCNCGETANHSSTLRIDCFTSDDRAAGIGKHFVYSADLSSRASVEQVNSHDCRTNASHALL